MLLSWTVCMHPCMHVSAGRKERLHLTWHTRAFHSLPMQPDLVWPAALPRMQVCIRLQRAAVPPAAPVALPRPLHQAVPAVLGGARHAAVHQDERDRLCLHLHRCAFSGYALLCFGCCGVAIAAAYKQRVTRLGLQHLFVQPPHQDPGCCSLQILLLDYFLKVQAHCGKAVAS